jgi:hypothetical protein
MTTQTSWRRVALPWIGAVAAAMLAPGAGAQSSASVHQKTLQCSEHEGIFCAEQADVPGYEYVGHDEPSLLFYSDARGSGNNNVWRIRLPKDPLRLPQDDGKGGTWNFMLHPAFWLGMAMCDSQSYPLYTSVCRPDTDENIFDSANPHSSHYVGKHPGTGFLEMQFYPPGWLNSNSATQWTAAMVIWSLSQNANNGRGNNPYCGGAIEYGNFAYIQTDGVPFPAGSPSPLGPFVALNANTLFMNPGDELILTIVDTEHGLKITVQDLTTGQTGFMVASAANGFAQIKYDPDGTNCDFATHNLPYDFHPMYATSSEHTRVPWAAHSYNIAFADETGHFEYCSAVDAEGGNCLTTSTNDPPGLDDAFCFDAGFAASFGLVPIGGCIDGDADFDGVPYRRHTWPGTFEETELERVLHAEPYIFTSPVFTDRSGHAHDYSRVAFETDLPRIETNTNPVCQRHISNPADPNPGAGCVNPPVGADFYPIFTTRVSNGQCRWQLGGRHLPHTAQDFGGTSAAEYGPLLVSAYPAANGQPSLRFNNFRRVLNQNPCNALGGGSGD